MSNQPTVGDPTLGGIELDMSNGNGPWGGNNGGSNGSGSGPWGGNAGGSGNRPQRGSGGGSQDNGNSSANVEDFLERVRRNSNGGGGGNRPNRGGGSGGPGGGDVVALLQRWWWLVLLGLVGAWLASGFYTVDASDRAVVTTFGRISGESGPGLHWRLPSPIQEHQTVNVLEPQETTIGGVNNRGESLMLTSDINIVDVELTIRWLVSDPTAFLYTTAQRSRDVRSDVEKVVKVAGEAALRSVIGRTTLESVLAQGKDIVQSDVKLELQETLNSYQRLGDSTGVGLGVEIDNVLLVNAQPPQQVKPAFDDVQDARQDQERFRNEAEARRNVLIPQAEAQAVELLQSAEAYKAEQESLAKGERDRFLAVLDAYQNNPDVTVRRLYIETMERILAQRGAVVLDGNLGDSALPLLNLSTSAAAN